MSNLIPLSFHIELLRVVCVTHGEIYVFKNMVEKLTKKHVTEM
jgi:hypothetical protein